MARLLGTGQKIPGQHTQTRSIDIRSDSQKIQSIITGLQPGDPLRETAVALAAALDKIQTFVSQVEFRIRNLAEPILGTQPEGYPAPIIISTDHIRGGYQIQGQPTNVQGQSLDLTFQNQVSTIASIDHNTGGQLELDIIGNPISFTGAITMSTPLPVASGGTGTSTGSITGTGALTFTAGGSNQSINFVPSGTGGINCGNSTATSTATPLALDLGGTYSSAAGANPKLRLFNSGGSIYGLGVSFGQLDYIVSGTFKHAFYVNSSERFEVNNNGVKFFDNTTGAGSAALGANSPAGTLTAPYTWLKCQSSDGSTVYIPAWK